MNPVSSQKRLRRTGKLLLDGRMGCMNEEVVPTTKEDMKRIRSLVEGVEIDL